jgi:SNF5 / SMARCB1 / INI1
MDIDGQKLRDTFLWNKNETLLSPEQVGAFFKSFGQGQCKNDERRKFVDLEANIQFIFSCIWIFP